jgi:hypothetical protein
MEARGSELKYETMNMGVGGKTNRCDGGGELKLT